MDYPHFKTDGLQKELKAVPVLYSWELYECGLEKAIIKSIGLYIQDSVVIVVTTDCANWFFTIM